MIWFLTSSTVDCYVLILGHAYNVRHFSGGWVLKVESITTITFKYNNKKSINLHSTRFKKTFSTFYKSVFGLKVYFWPIFDTLIVSIYWCWQCHCYICQYIWPILHFTKYPWQYLLSPKAGPFWSLVLIIVYWTNFNGIFTQS